MAKNTLAIIGGGAVGTLALHDVLAQYEDRCLKHAAVPPIDIAWYDAQGRFGVTDAFDPNGPDSLCLSNPAYMVRPSAIARTIFYDFYRAAHGRDASLEACIPRRIYGEFLTDLVPKLETRAKSLGVHLRKIPRPVSDIARQASDAFRITDAAERPHQAGQLIVATGPARNSAMNAVSGTKGYIADPGQSESYHAAGVDFKDPNTVVIGFGFGNSFFDGIAMLEQELGFRGKYILVESHPRTPWVVTREKELPDDIYYKFIHFSPDKLPCPVSLEQLSAVLQKDINDLQSEEKNPLRFGIEHPLYYVAAFAMKYFQAWEKCHQPNDSNRSHSLSAFTALQRQCLNRLKDVISPQALDLYNAAVASGRVETVSGRILPAQIHHDSKNLLVPVSLNDGETIILKGHALINGMPQQGDWRHVKDGLLTRMRDRGLIRLCETGTVGLYDFEHALNQGIGLVGAAVDSIWGVHILANKMSTAVNTAVMKMTGLS